MQNILIAEDDEDIRGVLKLYLQGDGYQVFEADNGIDALEIAKKKEISLAILDVMMPQMNGFELTQELRKMNDIPIIILSAKNEDNDKILGLNLGADDYVTKPFNPLEVMARVKAHLRREYGKKKDVLRVQDLELNTSDFRLFREGEQIELTPTEYKIMYQLMQNPGRIFTKIQLYESVFGEYFESNDNTMMVHISKLRDKIEPDPKNPKYIKTIRGLGYKIDK